MLSLQVSASAAQRVRLTSNLAELIVERSLLRFEACEESLGVTLAPAEVACGRRGNAKAISSHVESRTRILRIAALAPESLYLLLKLIQELSAVGLLLPFYARQLLPQVGFCIAGGPVPIGRIAAECPVARDGP